MILRTLLTENFRQLYGSNSITFSHEPEKNVTVILGENGSGKTTLLNAFSWCLYGIVDLEHPDELLNHRALLKANDGEQLTVSVEVSFEARQSTYCFRRANTYEKQGVAANLVGEEFDATIRDAGGETTTVRDPVTTIEKLLPHQLAQFFFFRGEDVEALASQDAEDELRTGVESFLALEIIDRGIRHLGRTEKDLNNALKADARGELKRIQNDIDTVTADLDDAQIQREEADREIRALKALEADVDAKLLRFAEVRPKIEEKDRLGLGEQRTAALTAKDVAEKELLKAVSTNGFLAFGQVDISTPLALAEEAVSRGDLPARIKPQFVDDILEKAECICGITIDEAMAAVLLEWKANAGLAVVEEAVGRLRGDLKSLGARREDFLREYSNRDTALSLAVSTVLDLDTRISRLNAELEGRDFGLPDIQALQDKRTDIRDRQMSKQLTLGRRVEYIGTLNERMEDLIKKRSSLDALSADERLLEKRIAVVRAVVAAFAKLRDSWSEVVREYISADLSETWSQIAQLERRVELTANYTLSMKERSGELDHWVESAASSANRRAMALAFISSLIRLAREISEAPGKAIFFEGGLYPLVMDAPFATMDQFFKTQVPRGLADVVPQIALISSYDQWKDEVAGELGPRVGRWYVLELHRTDAQGQDLEIPIRGRRVPYVVGEAAAMTDWSIIREIKA
jgi:DNA sulfur modification protein DndD